MYVTYYDVSVNIMYSSSWNMFIMLYYIMKMSRSVEEKLFALDEKVNYLKEVNSSSMEWNLSLCLTN
jgi:hypothetical protein